MTRTLSALVASVTLMTMVVATSQEAVDVRTDILSGQAPRSYKDVSLRYDVTATPELIDVLDTEVDEAWHAALILGVVGDERAVEPLIELVEGRGVDSAKISNELSSARTQALKALGVIVYRTGNERALEYLIASLDDTIWRRRGVRGIAENWDSQERYDRQLSVYALFGLAYSGHPLAGEALRSLQQSPTESQTRLRSGLDGTLNSWLEVHGLVAERGMIGMEEYYEERRKESGIYPIRR